MRTTLNFILCLFFVVFMQLSSGSTTVEALTERSMIVNHEVRNQDLFIECIVPHFNFTKEKSTSKNIDGEGLLLLYINGEKVDEIHKAAFVVKGLPQGKHTIKLVLAHNDQTPYDDLEQEFEVEIP
jgi:hypothetical protein